MHSNINYAQSKNSVWCFGDSSGISFNNATPQIFASGMDGSGSCTAIADSSGNLKFYAYSYAPLFLTKVMNANHTPMLNSNPMQGAGSYCEMTIIPKPNSYNLYYLFYTGARGFIDTVYYAIIDMSLDSGLGSVTQKDIPLGAYRSGDCLTAIKHGNGRDWWVISKLSDINGTQLNRFFVYLITSDSIYQPIIQDFNDATDADIQKVIWHPSGDKFMLINVGGYMSEFNFDRCTGTISLNQNIYSEQSSNFNRFFWERAYSPNGNIFYTSNIAYPGFTNTGYLFQFDLTALNIPSTIDTLESYDAPIDVGAVRLAPDGRIYFSRAYESLSADNYPYPDSMRNYINENLSVINFPDSLGSSCNYQPFSFYLGGKRTYYGLPNNPNYDLGALQGSVCDTLTVSVNSPSVTNTNSTLAVFYYTILQTAFINAQRLKGKKYLMQVYDVMGKEVGSWQSAVSSGEVAVEFNMQNFASGMYVVSLQTEKERLVKKFVRE